jgi:hypothetical protein
MSIDRIGKGSVPPPPTPITGDEKANRADGAKTFEVHEPKAAASTSVEAVAPKGVGALERLRAGEIDLDGYLDLKVNEATAHLHGLRATELEGVRALLRDQIARDPALAELVQIATGQVPASKR